MVRRRTRATKSIVSVSGEGGVNVALLTKSLGGGAAAVVAANGNVLEDQYFASPKRKDCKIDCGVGERDNGRSDDCESFDPLQFVREVKEEIVEEINITRKSPSPGKSRAERGGISGRTIGVPLATRSQTRTIENYFKAKTAAKQLEKLQAETVEEKQEDTENNIEKTLADNPIQCKAINNDVEVLGDNNHDLVNIHLENHQIPLQIQCIQNAASNQHQELLQADFIFDLSEDTTDTDNTELSDEYSTASGGGGVTSSAQQPVHGISNFELHRSPIRGDSNSSRSSTTDNIFLQEPVLTLNVDKSPNQASSIKINKTLEIEPIFSSPPNITASALNGRFNKIVSLQCSPLKLRDSFGYEVQPAQAITSSNCYALNLEHDNSSCDSGVAFATTTLDHFPPQQTQQNGGVCASSARRRKPATPHRIVCPSPIKAPPRIVSPASNNIAGIACGAAGRKIAGSKSQRHMGGNTGSKTRRRLNQPKDVAIPHRTTEQNGCEKQNGYEDEEPCHHIKQEQDYESILMPAEKASIAEQEQFHDAAVNFATTQAKRQDIHDQKNQKLTNGKATTTKTTHQQPKMKLYQPPHTQPLAATNGNRELTTFFQVRRSERKTKTAVKEEMMRNLEQAILEERADGLKIAHFENKGRGIVSERRFQRGEFVVEYIGDLISMTEAAEREKQYALDENAGCYMYYFKHKNQQYCIDATIDTGKLGRLVNHSRNGNLITKVVVVKQRPHLILIAKDDIEAGEELTYDYGDRSKESLLHHPWLAF